VTAPAGRYGYQLRAFLAELWLGVLVLLATRWLLLAARWVISTVGPRALELAGRIADRIAELHLLMDGPPAEGVDFSGVVAGEVVSVRYEESKETVRS
jgi:hypothetical protein